MWLRLLLQLEIHREKIPIKDYPKLSSIEKWIYEAASEIPQVFTVIEA